MNESRDKKGTLGAPLCDAKGVVVGIFNGKGFISISTVLKKAIWRPPSYENDSIIIPNQVPARASEPDDKIDVWLLHRLKAACCRIVDASQMTIGVGLLLTSAQLSCETGAAVTSEICIITSSTLVPSAEEALGASFEFQNPSDLMAERPCLVRFNLVILILNL
jgi:hypothetical protein